MTTLFGNKGEWSEIYVFLRLLSIGKLYAADEDLNRLDNVFYNILKIVRDENNTTLDFIFNANENTVCVVNNSTNETLLSLSAEEFKNQADKLYRELLNSQGSSFSIEDTENFLSNINVHTLKAKSYNKTDIKIKIHDINSGFEAIQGFSIKSRLGSPSTLINAGKTTNFIFKVVGSINDDITNTFNTCSTKFKDKFDFLKESGCDIVFEDMENNIFKNNLILIDGDLPKITAELLKLYYLHNFKTVSSAIEELSNINPVNYPLSSGHPFYNYKFKKLLKESALGMVPSKVWLGRADATGGYIIVKEDGDVLCYHLFNMNEFESYLLNNTKFETASTSRHDFGYIYKENNDYYIKLNLQIRFIK